MYILNYNSIQLQCHKTDIALSSNQSTPSVHYYENTFCMRLHQLHGREGPQKSRFSHAAGATACGRLYRSHAKINSVNKKTRTLARYRSAVSPPHAVAGAGSVAPAARRRRCHWIRRPRCSPSSPSPNRPPLPPVVHAGAGSATLPLAVDADHRHHRSCEGGAPLVPDPRGAPPLEAAEQIGRAHV